MYELPLFLTSLLGLWLFSELVVRQSGKLAAFLKMSEMFVGMVILAIGTSLPELSVTILSLFQKDAGHLPLSTILGSSILQVTFVLGLVGVIGHLKTTKLHLRRDTFAILGSVGVTFLLAMNGWLGRLEGLLMLGLYGCFLWYLANQERVQEKQHPSIKGWDHALLFGVGIIGLLISAKIVVMEAVFFSKAWEVDTSFIGIFMVGIAAALPELSTSLVAVLRKKWWLALGTILGSIVANMLLVIGFGALFNGYAVPAAFVWFDLLFLLCSSGLVLLFFREKKQLQKWQAAVLIVLYIMYAIARMRWMM
ncbi:sodium:calcium antiporter [Candidatus Woesearchaeota archaeon]|nr:sodium:calcium antiporter [Candidatus Woesearchaeota archaeon]